MMAPLGMGITEHSCEQFPTLNSGWNEKADWNLSVKPVIGFVVNMGRETNPTSGVQNLIAGASAGAIESFITVRRY